MATTIRGGRYRTAGGLVVNAFGEPLEEPTPPAPRRIADDDGKVDETLPTVGTASTESESEVHEPPEKPTRKPTRKPRAKRK